MNPTPDKTPPAYGERVCRISFEIARIRVGGGPEERPGFWRAYREALDVNLKTGYRNDRVKICAPLLRQLNLDPEDVHFWRHGRLVRERNLPCPSDASPKA